MTTNGKPRTRNTRSDLGPGDACDRILELEAELPNEKARATQEVESRFACKVTAILARVPADLRDRCRDMLKGAGYSRGLEMPVEPAPKVVAGDTRPIESPTNGPEPQPCGNPGHYPPGVLSPRLMQPVDPVPAGGIIETSSEKRARR